MLQISFRITRRGILAHSTRRARSRSRTRRRHDSLLHDDLNGPIGVQLVRDQAILQARGEVAHCFDVGNPVCDARYAGGHYLAGKSPRYVAA